MIKILMVLTLILKLKGLLELQKFKYLKNRTFYDWKNKISLLWKAIKWLFGGNIVYWCKEGPEWFPSIDIGCKLM